MTSIQSKIPIIVLIVLWSILQFISFWALYYENQWFERVLLLNIIFMIFFIIFFYTKVLAKSSDKTTINKESIKTQRDDFLYLKCPKCTESFAIKKSNNQKDKTIKITCPICGTSGKISIS